jgi:predicted nucleic acid-binding Zn ribbon protein
MKEVKSFACGICGKIWISPEEAVVCEGRCTEQAAALDKERKRRQEMIDETIKLAEEHARQDHAAILLCKEGYYTAARILLTDWVDRQIFIGGKSDYETIITAMICACKEKSSEY